ncbi:hypothetical protein K7X08_032759 [Anisodus acutangulus]|uniref:Uncharacterized protein n=1 Tax=Anisodus acutangulus TaxID=402998 RepID=A0A9Q1M0A3_9SOLA|nr:hypothetical protein K7X08_032759 [Anisodus acutangulus]
MAKRGRPRKRGSQILPSSTKARNNPCNDSEMESPIARMNRVIRLEELPALGKEIEDDGAHRSGKGELVKAKSPIVNPSANPDREGTIGEDATKGQTWASLFSKMKAKGKTLHWTKSGGKLFALPKNSELGNYWCIEVESYEISMKGFISSPQAFFNAKMDHCVDDAARNIRENEGTSALDNGVDANEKSEDEGDVVVNVEDEVEDQDFNF